MSEYAEMSSSDIPLNGSSDPAGSGAAGGLGSGFAGSGSGSGARPSFGSCTGSSAPAAGVISVSRTLAVISLSTICRSPNSIPRKDSFLNGSRSPYSWPTPKNSMGLDVTFTIDRAAPPLASASLFVSMEQSNCVYSWNSCAWLTASFPASESPTNILRSGCTTFVIFSICCIRLTLVCIRPAVSTSTQFTRCDFAYMAASLATAAGSEL